MALPITQMVNVNPARTTDRTDKHGWNLVGKLFSEGQLLMASKFDGKGFYP